MQRTSNEPEHGDFQVLFDISQHWVGSDAWNLAYLLVGLVVVLLALRGLCAWRGNQAGTRGVGFALILLVGSLCVMAVLVARNRAEAVALLEQGKGQLISGQLRSIEINEAGETILIIDDDRLKVERPRLGGGWRPSDGDLQRLQPGRRVRIHHADARVLKVEIAVEPMDGARR